MKNSLWNGVLPAITTPFTIDDAIDVASLAAHVTYLADHGCTGIVALGSLGEGGLLSRQERSLVVSTLVGAVGKRIPIIVGIGALSTSHACDLALDAANCGASALMVLPPYAYVGTWPETRGHFASIFGATPLTCMLYNNPIAYGTDVSVAQAIELGKQFPQLEAIKESSGDVRRITSLVLEADNRFRVLVGVDDQIVEGLRAGACGWVAGIVNSFAPECLELFNRSLAGDRIDQLYRSLLPLLRLDVVPDFVQRIKFSVSHMHQGRFGSGRVRPPRLALGEQAAAELGKLLDQAAASRQNLRLSNAVKAATVIGP